MIDPQTLERYRAAVASGIKHPLLEYYEARLNEVAVSLVSCTKENFQQYQGRALELQEIIKIIKNAR